MRIGVSHSRYIASRIALDLNRKDFVKFSRGVDAVISEIEIDVRDNLERERSLEERVKELLSDYEDDMEFEFVDEKELFKMVKKKLAKEYGVILSYEERFSDLAHIILQDLLFENLISFEVNEVRIKTIIFDSITNYIEERFEVEDIVIEKIDKMKRKLIPGTDEYQIVYNKLYEDELRRRGAM
jgi:hypothetical protein